MTTGGPAMVAIAAEDLRTLLTEVFLAVGVDRPDAELVARTYVNADLNGLSSHGVMRVPRIFAGIEAGTHFPDRRPTVTRDGPAFAVIDGAHALGVVVGVTAMRTAMSKAKAVGVGCVTVHNTNHFGTAGFFCQLAAEQRMIGMALCNGSPAVAAPGGNRAVIGPNPIAISAPTRSRPIVLDMSIAAVVRGRVLEHQRRKLPLPPGVALGPDRQPTTDPSIALAGSFLAFGGEQAYKAFGLGVMIDILSGPLAGAAYTDRVQGSADTTQECTVGDFFLAIDIGQLRDYEQYLEDVEDLARIVRDSGTDVYLPGDIEAERAAASGGMVHLDDDMAVQLAAAARRLSVPLPAAFASLDRS
jgi:L-2-hydroxycarboxylate dehydrogenase (NAD+)